jgi:hypothetical protein
MPTRYWVGGTGTWSSTNTANWSESSGGSTGASVPTAADDVVFDAGSDSGGVFTVTIASSYTALCQDFTVTSPDFTMSLARGNTLSRINVSGSWDTPATGFTQTIAAIAITFNSSTTGKTIAMRSTNPTGTSTDITFNNASGGWTFTAEPFRLGGFTLTAGTVDTANYNIEVNSGSFAFNGTGSRSLTLGSSVITMSGTSPTLQAGQATNATFNAGTSKFVFTALSSVINAVSDFTFYDFDFTNTSATSSISLGTGTVKTDLVCRNFDVTGAATASTRTTISMGGNDADPGSITTSGRLKIDASTDVRRRILIGASYTAFRRRGVKAKLICNGTVSLVNCDFRNVDGEGTAAPLSGTSLGNLSNCTGITFTAAKTCYLRGTAAAGNWNGNVWAATSTGSNDVANFPLGQDTVIISNDTLLTSFNMQSTSDGGSVCEVFDASARTTTLTSTGTSLNIAGNDGEIIFPDVSFGTTGLTVIISSTNGVEIDVTGTSLSPKLSWSVELPPTAVTQLKRNLTVSGTGTTDRSFTFASGIFDLNGYTLTTSHLILAGGTLASDDVSRSIEFNGGAIVVPYGLRTTSITLLNASASTNLTFPDNGEIEITGSTASANQATITGGCPALRLKVTASYTGMSSVPFNGVFKDIDMTSFTGVFGTTGCSIHGSISYGANTDAVSSSANTVTFVGSGTGTLSMADPSKKLAYNQVINGSGRVVNLGSEVKTKNGFTVTQGTLNLAGYDLYCDNWTSSGTSTRTISIGSPANLIYVEGTAKTVSSIGGSNISFPDGRPTIVANTNATSGTRTFSTTSATEASALNMRVAAGTDTVAVGSYFDVDFTGFSGTLTNAARTLYGSVTVSSGMTFTAGTSVTTFAGSGTMTFTSNANTLDFPITLNGSGTLLLSGDLNISNRRFTLTAGTLSLAGDDLFCGDYIATGTSTRAVDIGADGLIYVRASSGTVSDVGGSNVSFPSGKPTIVADTNATSGTRTFLTTSATEASSYNLSITAGSATATITGAYNNINFTGFSGTLTNSTRTVYGSVTISTGMTITAGVNVTTFAGSGTMTLTSNGQTIDFAITVNGSGTFQPADTMNIAARALTLTAGGLNDNGQNITMGNFSSSNSNVRTLSFNGGTWIVTSSGSTAWLVTISNLTTGGSGVSTISMTSGSAKTFSGGGADYGAATLNQGGAGTLTISGSNSFNDWTATTRAQFTITAATTQTFTNFTLIGTTGEVVLLRSTTASNYTLFKSAGIVDVDFLDIQRATATGGALWYAGDNSVDSGNNSGWIFSDPPPKVLDGKFFFLFDWTLFKPAPISVVWTGDAVPYNENSDPDIGSFSVTAEDIGLCGNFRRRAMRAWEYFSEELAECFEVPSCFIYGVRFYVIEEPEYQPFPNYHVGIKLHFQSESGATILGEGIGFTLDSNVAPFAAISTKAPATFITDQNTSFYFPNPIFWRAGDNLGIGVGWGAASNTSNSGISKLYRNPTGPAPLVNPRTYRTYTDYATSAGSFDIETDAVFSTGQFDPVSVNNVRPVVQFLIVNAQADVSGEMTFSVGAGGAGGVGANDGADGGTTTLTFRGVTITCTGGKGGKYNTGATAEGGLATGGLNNYDGGYGAGATGNVGGGGGGSSYYGSGYADVISDGTDGMYGADSITYADQNLPEFYTGYDPTGLYQRALVTITGPLLGEPTEETFVPNDEFRLYSYWTGYFLAFGGFFGLDDDPENDQVPTPVLYGEPGYIGGGGGGAGYLGGRGGDGSPGGGGGGGAAGNTVANLVGGDGGIGLIVVRIDAEEAFFLTPDSVSPLVIPSGTNLVQVWVMGGGGGGAGATDDPDGAGGGGGGGALAYYYWR